MADSRTLTRLLERVLGTEYEERVRRARDRAAAEEGDTGPGPTVGRPDYRGQEAAGMLPRPRTPRRAKRDEATRQSHEYLRGKRTA